MPSQLSNLLLSQWHPTLNSDLTVDDVSPGSKRKVWWQDEFGHEWEAAVGSRTKGSGCPYCSGRFPIAGVNDLATTHPELVIEWAEHNVVSADKVSAGSHAAVWWQDSFGHEWEASVASRALRGRGCPFCSGNQILTGFNDLSTLKPELASQWHVTKNLPLTPGQVGVGSSQLVWWQDEFGHEWEAKIAVRVRGVSNCPTCSGRKIITGVNNFASTHPVLATEWDVDKNTVDLSVVTKGSDRKAWWLCGKGHSWEASVSSRVRGSQCPYCSGRVVVAGETDLATTHPSVAAEWHPTKNLPLMPNQVGKGSERQVWWQDSFGHEWKALVFSRVAGNGCPVCAGRDFDLKINAPLSQHLVEEWHPTKNNDVSISTITAQSNKKVWWLCSKGHEWEAVVYSRSKGNKCPFCSGYDAIPGETDIQTLYPLVAAEWHLTKNLSLTPSEVGKGSAKSVWWQCVKGHEWEATPYSRTVGKGCPKCAASSYISKAEKELFEFLTDLGLVVEQSNRKLLKGQELDLYVPEKKFAIEFNGVYYHNEFWKAKNYHHDKWLACKNLGIQLVQIWEDEWKRNPELVKNMLAHKLRVSSQRKVFARKTKVTELTTVEAQLFLGQNHIQGFASGSYYVGLKDSDGVVVSLLVLKKEAGDVLNIIRYATSANVMGGFTKLMSFAVKTYAPKAFITFADHCVSDGGLYENNGFVADREIAPDYMYVVKAERKHKFGYRLKRFKNDPDLLWEDGLTERQLALLNKIPRIWDAGKTRYRLDVNDR